MPRPGINLWPERHSHLFPWMWPVHQSCTWPLNVGWGHMTGAPTQLVKLCRMPVGKLCLRKEQFGGSQLLLVQTILQWTTSHVCHSTCMGVYPQEICRSRIAGLKDIYVCHLEEDSQNWCPVKLPDPARLPTSMLILFDLCPSGQWKNSIPYFKISFLKL